MNIQDMILDQLIYEIPRNQWGECLDAKKKDFVVDIQSLSDHASNLSVIAAELSEYFDYRGAAGCGDHGHDAALAKAQKRRKKVRKALGYTCP